MIGFCACTNRLPCIPHRCRYIDEKANRCKGPALQNGYCSKRKHRPRART